MYKYSALHNCSESVFRTKLFVHVYARQTSDCLSRWSSRQCFCLAVALTSSHNASAVLSDFHYCQAILIVCTQFSQQQVKKEDTVTPPVICMTCSDSVRVGGLAITQLSMLFAGVYLFLDVTSVDPITIRQSFEY